MPTKNEALDDWLPDLPDLDGEEGESAADELEHELLSFDEDAADPLDDAAAEDLLDAAAEIDFDFASDAPDGDEREIDIGEITIDEIPDDEADKSAAEDESQPSDLGFDIDDETDGSEDDGGEEGLLDASEEAIDEALPELDADESDELSEGLLLEDPGSLVLDDEQLPGWADVAWETKPLSLSFEAKGELLSLSMSERTCAAINAHGELLVSLDGGESFERARSDELSRADMLAQVAALEDGTSYLLTGSGALLVREASGDKIARHPRRGLLAIAARGKKLGAISADPSRGLELIESEDGGTSWTARELAEAAVVVAAAPNPVLAVNEGAVVMGSEAGLVISRDGADFELIPGCSGTVAVAFAGEGSLAPLVAAVYRETENRTYLVRVSVEGHAEVVADLGPTELAEDDEAEPLGCANTLAWDSARQVLWVAGAFGLLAVAA